MSHGCQMVRGGPVTEMSVLYQAEPLQLLDIPIDRGEVDVGSEPLHIGCELVDRPMPTRRSQRANEESAGSGHPVPLGSENLDKACHCRVDVGGGWGVDRRGHGGSLGPRTWLRANT